MKVKLKDVASFSKGQQINGDDLLPSANYAYLNGGISPSGYWNEYNIPANSIAISEGGNSCGYVNYMQSPFWCGAHCYYLFDLKISNTKYLYYALKARQDDIMKLRSGACMPNIKKSDLGEFAFEFDFDDDHQTIVVDQLERVERMIALRKQQLSKLDELVKSRFIEMFENGNFPLVKAEDVCEFITKGTTPPTGEIYTEFGDNRIPYLKVYNLSFDGSLLFDCAPQYIDKSVHNGKLSRSKVYPNDVLMNIVGPPLGKFSLVTSAFAEWNINQAISIFRAKYNVLPRFLLSALMQPTVLEPFLKQAVGVRQLNISLEQCRNIQFPLPPIELQAEFVAFAEQTDKSKLEIQKSLEKLETLKKALMQKYFG